MGKQDTKKPSMAKIYALILFLLVVIFVLGDLYITKSSQNITIQNNTNSSSGLQSNINQLQGENQNLNSQLQQIENNQKTPIITDIYQDKMITLTARNSSILFYNSTYNLYNNYTVASSQNFTLNFKYNGYLIINIMNVSGQYSNLAPPIGTWGIQVHSSSLEEYYSYILRMPVCNYIVGYGEYCQNSKAITLGWGLYPVNYSATYLAPVGYGNVTLTFTNSNNYPLNVEFSVTYVGENYTNLIPITDNYSSG